MATIPLDVEKLLAACVLCFGPRRDLKPIEVNLSLDRYSVSSFHLIFLFITFRLSKPVLNGQLPIVNLTFKSVDDMLQFIIVTCCNSIYWNPFVRMFACFHLFLCILPKET